MVEDRRVRILVYYAAVAKGNVVIAEYPDGLGLSPMALNCLEHIPPLHNRFSYTTQNRMFICLIDGLFTYFAIMDQALSRSKAFMFLEHVRDGFKGMLEQGLSCTEPLTPRTFDKKIVPLFKALSDPLSGIPRSEEQTDEELEPYMCTDDEFNCSSLSSIIHLYKKNDEFDKIAEQNMLGSQPLTEEMLREHVKAITVETYAPILETGGKNLDAVIDHRAPWDLESQECGKRKWEQSAQGTWRRNVQLVIMLDAFLCMILLALWMGVCDGGTCLHGHS